MKILTSGEIKRLEAKAGEQGVSMQQLMRNAGLAAAQHVSELAELSSSSPAAVAVLCGRGNNGGDGFVCAMKLWDDGFDVIVVLADGEPSSPLAVLEYRKLLGKVRVVDFAKKSVAAEVVLRQADVIVDAIFGFGFKGELKGKEQEIVKICNKLGARKLSIDLPSGVECDTARVSGLAFRAEKTVTFSALKPACVSFPAAGFCGEVVVEDVGVPSSVMESAESKLHAADGEYVRGKLPFFLPDAHKGTRGTLVMVCGSYGMIGAAVMAAKAALRSGVGLLNMVVEEKVYPLIAAAVPEAVFTILKLEDSRSYAELRRVLERADACVVGCGLGKTAKELCSAVIDCCEVPLVIDADGLNYLAENKAKLRDIKCPVLLTPHPGEMARLTGFEVAAIQKDRLNTAREYARENKVNLLLKGAGTIVTNGEESSVNTNGNPGMAKGGSGDVLSGIIGAFAAQGMELMTAGVAGAYVHGLAGDMCAAMLTERAMQPTDMIEMLPEVFVRKKM